MKVKIFKSTPKGVLNAPSSKSYSHRYLIASGLANNPSTVSNIYFSNDVMASLNCLSSFGCAYKMDNNGVEFINNSYINDNLCGNDLNLKISTIKVLNNLAIDTRKNLKLINKDLPIYIISGSHDSTNKFSKQNFKLKKKLSKLKIKNGRTQYVASLQREQNYISFSHYIQPTSKTYTNFGTKAYKL